MNSSRFPIAAKVIKADFYVDDLLTGADDVTELMAIKDQIQLALNEAGLKLHKWYSNNANILQEIPQHEQEKLVRIQDSDIIRTLGIAWDPVADNFRFVHQPALQRSSRVTKRVILSDLARIYDPLGFINPIVVRAKIFMQHLWLLKLNWDESVPLELHSQWESFRSDMSNLKLLKIPRLVIGDSSPVNIEIHGFSDASTRAYGGCIYIRCTDSNGNIAVSLLVAKSKVAPLKTRTLPCLELCAAELLVKLLARVKEIWQRMINAIYLWTDSQIVLGWLASHASTWQTFVRNTVSIIQDLTADAIWRYVPTKLNPADIVSRGCSVSDLINSNWFSGPDFLYQSHDLWPQPTERLVQLPEKRKSKQVFTCIVQQAFVEHIYKYSCFRTVRRIMAFVLRFIHNLKKKKNGEDRQLGCLTVKELDNAFLKIVWMIQQIEFAAEIRHIAESRTRTVEGSLQCLSPFMDNLQMLRVGGRLQNANLPYNVQHPILLPKNNPFVKAYIRHLHFKNFHAGPQTLVAILRERFWIINARQYTRKVVRECVHCFRYRPKLLQQVMADLPTDRLEGSMAFVNVGVDFCGPIWTTFKTRGKRPYKSYIAVFVCFASRGVHLEVVSDLSSEAFIATLKRFISRRRLCRRLYCDNELCRIHSSPLKNSPQFAVRLKQHSILDQFVSCHQTPTMNKC